MMPRNQPPVKGPTIYIINEEHNDEDDADDTDLTRRQDDWCQMFPSQGLDPS